MSPCPTNLPSHSSIPYDISAYGNFPVSVPFMICSRGIEMFISYFAEIVPVIRARARLHFIYLFFRDVYYDFRVYLISLISKISDLIRIRPLSGASLGSSLALRSYRMKMYSSVSISSQPTASLTFTSKKSL